MSGNVWGKVISLNGLVATGDQSSNQWKAVKFGSTANTIKVVDATTDSAIGVLLNDPTDGQTAEVAGTGSVVQVLAGANDIAAGEVLGFNTTGQLEDHTTAGRWVIAQALESSTAVGDLIKVQIVGLHGYA